MQTKLPERPVIHRWGKPDKKSLLFLHANSFSAKMYQPFLAPLFDSYDIIAPDLPGHGESRWNGRIGDWEMDMAEFYSRFLQKNPPQQPMVGMGHSIGGVVIMLLAIKHPQWFSQIVLLDPVMLPKRILAVIRVLRQFSLTHLIPLAQAANKRRQKFSSTQQALDHYSSKQVFSHWDQRFLEAYVATCLHQDRSGGLQLSCAPQLESSIYQSIPLNVWALPRKLSTPSLFIIGEHSDTVNQRGVKRLRRLLGNDVVKRIDGGHLFPFEKPAASIELIKDFLSI